MGSKNSKNAQNALDGADNQPLVDPPSKDEGSSDDCKTKHWIAVRVELRDGYAGGDGHQEKTRTEQRWNPRRDVGPGNPGWRQVCRRQVLDATDDCQVSAPDMYDAEVTPK